MHLASANPKDLVEKQHHDSRRLTGWGVLLAASVFSCLCVRASGAEANPPCASEPKGTSRRRAST